MRTAQSLRTRMLSHEATFRQIRACMAATLLLLAVGPSAGEEKKTPLPRPAMRIPTMPPLAPAVVTTGGQRLLLSQTDLVVHYEGKRLVTNKPGWWAINYPLERIRGLEGKSRDQVARLLFGRPAAEVRNWYLRIPGASAPEPPAPGGPAPITPTPSPTLVVSPEGDDANPGTAAAPLKSIGTAVKRAKPGSVIHVQPGIYRESVKIEASGTAAAPIRLEGIRDAGGRMPVISGNDPFPPNAWKLVPGIPGVYRADLFTGQLGTLSVDGRTLVERGVPQELKPGEYCLNRASEEFLRLRCEGMEPAEGREVEGKRWRRAATDGEGFLDLGTAFGAEAKNAVVWASAWVWVAPKPKEGVVWDPRFPQPITGRLEVGGEFRAARMTGSNLASQVNKYRVWANGERLPSVVYSHKEEMQLHLPRPHRNYGFSDHWERFTLKEGWNHLLFQFDTTSRPEKLRFRFGVPKGVGEVVTSVSPPADRAAPSTGTLHPFVSEYLLLGPFPDKPDRGVYVRLPGDADPNRAPLDLAARAGALVDVQADFVQVRGFEIRHGAQFQQRAQVNLQGEGILLEGCLIRDSEVKGISFTGQKDQTAAPIVVRGNWVINPGNTGIGGSGSSEQLTPENQNGAVPGRSPVLIEHNRIVNNNWTGTAPFWESGGMKLFRLTGSVVRYNTIVGGSGPGIWLDWEHFNNRIEGNLFLDAWAFGVGIEASPGPNLVANNVSVDLRPGEVWFRYGVLSWSSDRNLVLHNTIDGRWNKLPAWQNHDGADGIFLHEGGDDRNTRWGALTGRKDTVLNNVVVGCDVAVRSRPTDTVAANYTDKGKGAQEVPLPLFLAPERDDCRVLPESAAALKAAESEHLRLVRHDFYGLPRLPGQPQPAGAFRLEPEPGSAPLIEVEMEDGTFVVLDAAAK